MVWFKILVVGISNLESVWKAKNNSELYLRQLEEHYRDPSDAVKKYVGTSVGVARAGFKVLLDIMDNKLFNDNFVSKFTLWFLIEKFNAILETAVNTLDMSRV